MSQYIGKTISLISVTDNRYVGLLENIDSEKGTITLGNVRCFGTEGRKNWGPEEIFPNPTIYQSVQFNGNDVKDLSILEVRLEDVHPVLQPTTNQLPIVPPSSVTAQQQQQMTNMNENQKKQTSGSSMEQESVKKNIPAAVAGYGVYAPTQTIDTGIITTTTTTESFGSIDDNKGIDDESKNNDFGVTTNTTNATSEPPKISNEFAYNTQQQRHSNSFSHRTRNQKIEIPNNDFDFASNNAKFMKENTSMTSDKERTGIDDSESELTTDSSKKETFYDKKSSFFDNISTSTEINTNMRWQEEKELNLDTFGQVSIRPRFYSNRGRGRGNYRGRGRGNYRGRGRGNNNNNYRGRYYNNNYRNNRNNNNNNNREFHNNFNQGNDMSSFQNQQTVEF